MTITCVERLAITNSGSNALVFHYVRYSKDAGSKFIAPAPVH